MLHLRRLTLIVVLILSIEPSLHRWQQSFAVDGAFRQSTRCRNFGTSRSKALRARRFLLAQRSDEAPRTSGRQKGFLPKPSRVTVFCLVGVIVLLGLRAFASSHGVRPNRVTELALSSMLDFLSAAGSGSPHVTRAILGSSQCVLVLDDGRRLFARWPIIAKPAMDEIWLLLRQAHIPILAERPPSVSPASLTGLAMVAYVIVVIMMMRRMANGGGASKTYGDQRSKVLRAQGQEGSADASVTRFQDIAGIDEAKLQVQEVVNMLKSPGRYAALGARVPRGILMAGPPGSGKTMLARASAAEAGVPFLSVAATEFVELFVGRGAQRVRQLFEKAEKLAPCIVFIDEVDALRARGNDVLRMPGNQEADQTLNQLLTCMDGLTRGDKPIVVIGATNRPDVLDEALLRPGRFDRLVQVGLPEADGRAQILRVHIRLKKVPLAADVVSSVLDGIAQRASGLSGAALESLVNEAAIRAARRDSTEVSASDLEEALLSYKSSRSPKISFPWKL